MEHSPDLRMSETTLTMDATESPPELANDEPRRWRLMEFGREDGGVSKRFRVERKGSIGLGGGIGPVLGFDANIESELER